MEYKGQWEKMCSIVSTSLNGQVHNLSETGVLLYLPSRSAVGMAEHLANVKALLYLLMSIDER